MKIFVGLNKFSALLRFSLSKIKITSGKNRKINFPSTTTTARKNKKTR
jgi:hypothetical protein